MGRIRARARSSCANTRNTNHQQQHRGTFRSNSSSNRLVDLGTLGWEAVHLQHHAHEDHRQPEQHRHGTFPHVERHLLARKSYALVDLVQELYRSRNQKAGPCDIAVTCAAVLPQSMQVFDAVAPAAGDDSDDSTAWTELLLIGNSERKS